MMNSNAMGMSQSPLTPAKARLSDQQKKDNHISSEKKRREAIRSGFDKLSTLVPGMEGQARSEAIVLGATVNFMQDEIARKHTVRQLAISHGWSEEKIDKIYSDFEASLRVQEQREVAALMGQPGPSHFNGQGQFQNTYTQMSQPPMQMPPQPVAPQQPMASIQRRSRSKSKSISPGASPTGIRKSSPRSPKRNDSQ